MAQCYAPTPLYAAQITASIAPGTSPNQQQALQAALDQAWAQIVGEPSCDSFLTGSSGLGYVAALAQLANTLSNTVYTFDNLDLNVAATTNALGGNQVTINTSGAFFSTPGGAGTAQFFGPNSQGQQTIFTFQNVATLDAEILLHELGHETGVLPADGGSAAAMNGPNNANILNNCFTQNAQGVYQ
jgi:hypothetical protein